MAVSTFLFDLIKSLSASEKRYFKRYASQYSQEQNQSYNSLFDLLSNCSTYEDSVVKDKLGYNGKESLFSANKNYLYNLILKCLRAYNAEQSASIRLRGLIIDITLLLERGLLNQAKRRLAQAKKLAKTFHYNMHLIEILLLERQLLRRFKSNKAIPALRLVQHETSIYSNNLLQQLDILETYDQVFIQRRNRQEGTISLEATHKKIREYANRFEDNEFDFESSFRYYLLCAIYFKESKDDLKAQQALKNIIALFGKWPQMMVEKQEKYINSLNNYINGCYLLGQYEEFNASLKKMRLIKAKNLKAKIFLFHNYYYLKLLFLLKTKEYEQALLLIPDIEKGLIQYKNNITKSRLMTLNYNIGLTYFLSGQYSEALERINTIANEPRLEERRDLQAFSRLIKLITYFELGHTTLTDYFITAVVRFLKQTKSYSPFAKIIVEGIKQALYADLNEQHQILQEVLTTFQQQGVDRDGHEEFYRWLENRLKGSGSE